MRKLKVSDLAGYIVAKYGAEQLGLLRLLCTFTFFREAVTKDSLHKLLGIPMISFEKVLKDCEDVIYSREADRRFRVTRRDRTTTVNDDPLCTVSSFIVGTLRDEFNKYAGFGYQPCLSLGVGAAVSDIADQLDCDRLDGFLLGNQEQIKQHMGDDYHFVTKYTDARVMAVGTLKDYKVAEAAHKLLVCFRRKPFPYEDKGEPLPFAAPEEMRAVLMGFKESSLRALPRGFNGKLKEVLMEYHREAEFDDERNFLLYETVDMFGYLELLPTPKVKDFAYDNMTPVTSDRHKKKPAPPSSGAGPSG